MADLLGSLVVAATVVPEELCIAMLINSRCLYPQSQRWSLYRDNLGLALALHRREGLTGLQTLLCEANRVGRGAIKTRESSLLSDPYATDNTSAVRNSAIEKFESRYMLFNQHHAVSPMAHAIAGLVKVGDGPSSVAQLAGISEARSADALSELQDRAFVIALEDGRVVADETKPLLAAHALRYTFTDSG
jgi:hypothetical protein